MKHGFFFAENQIFFKIGYILLLFAYITEKMYDFLETYRNEKTRNQNALQLVAKK